MNTQTDNAKKIQEIIFWSNMNPEEKEDMLLLWQKIPAPTQAEIILLCERDSQQIAFFYNNFKQKVQAVINKDESSLQNIFTQEDDYLKATKEK